jgi:hypothetical protein
MPKAKNKSKTNEEYPVLSVRITKESKQKFDNFVEENNLNKSKIIENFIRENYLSIIPKQEYKLKKPIKIYFPKLDSWKFNCFYDGFNGFYSSRVWIDEDSIIKAMLKIEKSYNPNSKITAEEIKNNKNTYLNILKLDTFDNNLDVLTKDPHNKNKHIQSIKIVEDEKTDTIYFLDITLKRSAKLSEQNPCILINKDDIMNITPLRLSEANIIINRSNDQELRKHRDNLINSEKINKVYEFKLINNCIQI